MVAAVGARGADRARAAGADQVVDGTGDLAAAVTEPVDVLLNLAPIDPDAFAALVAVVRDGGVVVSTTVWMPTPGDDARGVRAVDLFVRSDAAQAWPSSSPASTAASLHVDVAERVRLADLPALHARAAAGDLPGKVVVTVAD
ncbi:hypothetical protein GCM10025868_16800 [Angustibacter aerolatus]|uniref:Alcohol dehydrogenase-like C-terminal domain-containing protein n=1 Tax=Angustibacter aerolatus TaxID=1162965 RepID=A0ABQ6JE16_9ACTN|nr:zinc-binding dehydrogenase [Angustibacter aerolatus]GMA86430.1 hypothetical protein GCM10025868_16800 [Angustibacter aerolatus]